MSSSGPVEPNAFVEQGGEIKIAKLVSTLLGAVWLTVAAGWIMVMQAVVTVHIRVLDAAAAMYVRVIEAAVGGGAETIEASWASAFRAAVETNRLLAPMIFSLEVIIVTALLLYTRRRWF
ncbi:hypothetical protein [Halorussus amylolyticus]|uniref:hypothetical protein n=1 Tax=Halorussus amylolyticus TaxID=1126242 RepID=UPI0010428C11|nr:hypothetical protein [Halorussus amylolyticus]